MAASAGVPDDSGGGCGCGDRIKLLCSLGGRILPRPGDGALRYAGGDTRIVSVHRGIAFPELVARLGDAYGGGLLAPGHFAIKYQLPDEGLDALISVSSPDDLENMLEEYDKLAGHSPKLRVFLFPLPDPAAAAAAAAAGGGSAGGEDIDGFDAGLSYLEAVNGIVRKDSIASLASTQNSDGAPPPVSAVAAGGIDAPSGGISPTILSPTSSASNDASRSIFGGQPLPPLIDVLQASSSQEHHAGQFANLPASGQPGVYGQFLQHPDHGQFAHAIAIPANPVPSETKANVNANAQENVSEARRAQAHPHAEARYRQPLSQLPPLPPVFLNDHREAMQSLHHAPPPLQQPGNGVRYEDCSMCLKKLPHAHSDPVVPDYAEGHVGMASEPGPVFMSLRPEDVARIMMSERMAVAPVGAYGYAHIHPTPHERDRMFPPKADSSTATTSGIANSVHVDPASFHQHMFVQQHPQQLPSSYGFSHIPVIPHEKERVVSPNAGGLATTAGNDHATSHQQLQQQQQQHHQQQQQQQQLHQQQQLPSSHGMPQYPVKQGTTNNQLLGEGSLSGNARYREDGQLRRDNVPPMAVPTYVANVDRMMDSLRVSPTEASGSNEQWKHAVSPDSSMPQNVIPEHPQAVPENSFITRSDTRVKEMHQNNAFFDVPEQKIETMPHPSVASSYLHTVQYANMSHMPHVMSIGGPYPSYLAATVGSSGVPPSYGVDLVYTNSAINPAIERKDAVPEMHHKESSDEVIAPSSGNAQVPTTAAPTLAANVEQLQESILPCQQHSGDDPWKVLANPHALPPRPKRVASKDNISPKDPYSNNSLSNCKGPDMNIPSDDVVLHQQSDPVNKEPHVEHARFIKGDVAKQDLLAMEEGSVASNLQPAEPQPHISVSQKGEPASILSEGVGAVTNKVDEVHTNEVLKSRPADWIHPSGFPITDDLGRLQIIKNNDLEELQELGSGTFGTVYHGKWRGSDVAIKRINDRCFAGKPSEQDKMRSDFWNEASNLADLHHPNVVAFYGVVLDGPGGSIATVTEYMVNGSLRQALLKNAKTLDRRKRLILAMDAAFGMEYLHNKNIVHFDLKSDNLLVNLRDPQRPICKVGDLGLSKVKCQTLISGGVRGTLPWMAPELLNGSSSLVSEKVDVFSFGIVLWELLTGEEPYADLHYGVIIGGIVSNTLRPPVPDSCDPEWRSLMEHCWSTEPSDRPSFTEVASRLRSMASSQKIQS